MRALSGLQATGSIHLGNYIGAIRNWAENQFKYEENYYFVPDLHTLNVRPDSKTLQKGIYEAVAMLVASGIDPAKSVIFTQSSVSAHSELFNILNNYVTMGELSRMTQFKDKQQKYSSEGVIVGLFEYPVLMAADILLYDVDAVPVGEDQKQHVELARDIAERFNNIHGETFKLPQAEISKSGARIMNLQDPSRKMSKSDNDTNGCIYLNDTQDEIRQKINRAVTDSDNQVKADKNLKPGVTNLLEIYSILSGKAVVEIEKKYAGKGYREFKLELADIIINVLEPLQQKYSDLLENKDEIHKILQQGQVSANTVAATKLREVKEKIGLVIP